MVTMVSSAIAPSVASWVGDAASYHACFLVAGALFSCGLVLAVLFKLPKDVRAQRREAAVRAQGGQAEAAGARPAGRWRAGGDQVRKGATAAWRWGRSGVCGGE